MKAAHSLTLSCGTIEDDYVGLTQVQQYFNSKFSLGSVSQRSILSLTEQEDPVNKNHFKINTVHLPSVDPFQTPPTIGVPKPNDFSNFTDYFLQKG